uniref:Uncharacterized protein n=1 Tax=Populus alba TaxID=43335 RepID=A0A4U5PPY3_POPAL|nr:hypothetical protein D5086_0000194370 [Populus alba]
MAVRGRPNPARQMDDSTGFITVRTNETTVAGETNRSFNQDRRRQGTFAGRRNDHIASHCGEKGHWVQTCYELNGYPMGHPRGRFQPGSRSFNNRGQAAGNHMPESSLARTWAVNHVAESSWARPPANSDYRDQIPKC